MKSVGYSGTPLAKKIGIKEGFTIRLFNQPAGYFDLFEDFPSSVKIVKNKHSSKDLVHYFITTAAELLRDIRSLRSEIFPAGALWVSWPKKSSGVKTGLTEDVIRKMALQNGLVDIKVCAVDEIWSALKLVVPVKERI